MVTTDQSASLPPGVLDQLVAQVADEVTRRLSPLEDTSTTSVSSARVYCIARSAAGLHLTCASQCCPGARYISYTSRNGWSHSVGVFKHHSNIVKRGTSTHSAVVFP